MLCEIVFVFLHTETKRRIIQPPCKFFHTKMLNKDKDLKAYYSIKEVSEMFDLNASTLRYWEKEFPHLKPRTMGNKVRQYSKSDIEELRLIHNLVKVRGFKLAAARKMMHANRAGAEKTSEIIEKMTSVRDQLMQLKKALETIR